MRNARQRNNGLRDSGLRNSRMRRSRVHRYKRFNRSRVFLSALLGLILIVSFAAAAFVGFMYFNDMIPVFATGERNEPAWAEETPPGWIGEFPPDSPDIGIDGTENHDGIVNNGGIGNDGGIVNNGGISNNDGTSSNDGTSDNDGTINNADIGGNGGIGNNGNLTNGTAPEPEGPFDVFSFFIASNLPYYEEFQARHPYHDAETVVWKVNAFLHLPFYYYIRVNNDPKPLLVNPFHRLPYGFSPAVLVPVSDDNPNLLATPETVEAFRRMRASAINAGLDIAVASAYRPASRQQYLFNRQGGRDGVVARPYQSEHQTGRALDLWGPTPSGLLDSNGPTPTGIWVAENAHNYGFIMRYTANNTHITGFIYEPWHITYVGLEIARHIHNNSLSSLEEFVARYPHIGLSY